MKYDARACHFNMDTGCVELLLRDGRKISIDCTGVEDAPNVTMTQQTELNHLIYNDPLGYADLILNGNPKEYLKDVAGILLYMNCLAVSAFQFVDCTMFSAKMNRTNVLAAADRPRLSFITRAIVRRIGSSTGRIATS